MGEKEMNCIIELQQLYESYTNRLSDLIARVKRIEKTLEERGI